MKILDLKINTNTFIGTLFVGGCIHLLNKGIDYTIEKWS